MESEEDHKAHMIYKKKASEKKKIPEEKMINKKYNKNPEKADLYYKGREKLIEKDLLTNGGNNYVRKKPIDSKRQDIDDKLYSKYYHDIEIGDKDIATKALTYIFKVI